MKTTASHNLKIASLLTLLLCTSAHAGTNAYSSLLKDPQEYKQAETVIHQHLLFQNARACVNKVLGNAPSPLALAMMGQLCKDSVAQTEEALEKAGMGKISLGPVNAYISEHGVERDK